MFIAFNPCKKIHSHSNIVIVHILPVTSPPMYSNVVCSSFTCIGRKFHGDPTEKSDLDGSPKIL